MLKLVDYATVRGRAGYAFGQFLPYAMLGVGVGRFNYSAFATVTDVQTPPVGGGTQTRTNSQDNIIMAGFVTGLGMDVAVLLNVFLRAGPVNGIKSSLNTGRVGLGLKF